MQYRIAVLIGSTRAGSLNRQLALWLQRLAPVSLRFEELAIADLPFCDPERDAARPAEVQAFMEAGRAAAGFLIVTPEYNRSPPALLKNALDWASRGNPCLWKDKPVAISGASPGALGAALAQEEVRKIVSVTGGLVMGGEAYITWKPELLEENGELVAGTRTFLSDYMARFAHLVEKLYA